MRQPQDKNTGQINKSRQGLPVPTAHFICERVNPGDTGTLPRTAVRPPWRGESRRCDAGGCCDGREPEPAQTQRAAFGEGSWRYVSHCLPEEEEYFPFKADDKPLLGCFQSKSLGYRCTGVSFFFFFSTIPFFKPKKCAYQC